MLDLGEECTLNDDECYPVHANVVLFDSPLDGELRTYGGNGRWDAVRVVRAAAP